ncbi:hypothetical protein BDY19DRAFT_1035610 [Irpex rosettiformis]|uniref:Uncharacterized protein n=1 Tax=Irpex rosettiformis TaxID=378272 RepID=A0ACB8U9L1_9APHY|nr:hypothetical protein BDY19DRAFT_1035610 [Irpex rosettiformis]
MFAKVSTIALLAVAALSVQAVPQQGTSTVSSASVSATGSESVSAPGASSLPSSSEVSSAISSASSALSSALSSVLSSVTSETSSAIIPTGSSASVSAHSSSSTVSHSSSSGSAPSATSSGSSSAAMGVAVPFNTLVGLGVAAVAALAGSGLLEGRGIFGNLLARRAVTQMMEGKMILMGSNEVNFDGWVLNFLTDGWTETKSGRASNLWADHHRRDVLNKDSSEEILFVERGWHDCALQLSAQLNFQIQDLKMYVGNSKTRQGTSCLHVARSAKGFKSQLVNVGSVRDLR